MQTQSYDENSICLSVRPSVGPSDAWIVTKRQKDILDFYMIQKIIYPSFFEKKNVGATHFS